MRYINFNQLRSFHAVAQSGNVTSASRLLNVSQPTVTTQLKQLEETYGVELVFRKARGIGLTPTGEALHRMTKRIFALEEDALNLFADARNLSAGEIRFGTVGPHYSIRLLTRFHREYPGVKINLTTSNSDHLRRQVLDFDLDIAIIGNVPDDPALESHLLSTQEVVLVVGRDHPWYGRDTVELRELHNTKVITREVGSETRSVIENVLLERDVHPDVVIEVYRDAVREAAREGLGVGILSEPEFWAGDDALHKIRISDAQIETSAHIVWLKERADMRVIKAVLDLV